MTEKDMDAYVKAHKKTFNGFKLIDIIISWLLVKGVQATIVLGLFAAVKALIVYLFL